MFATVTTVDVLFNKTHPVKGEIIAMQVRSDIDIPTTMPLEESKSKISPKFISSVEIEKFLHDGKGIPPGINVGYYYEICKKDPKNWRPRIITIAYIYDEKKEITYYATCIFNDTAPRGKHSSPSFSRATHRFTAVHRLLHHPKELRIELKYAKALRSVKLDHNRIQAMIRAHMRQHSVGYVGKEFSTQADMEKVIQARVKLVRAICG
jgi:hypothetical protein